MVRRTTKGTDFKDLHSRAGSYLIWDLEGCYLIIQTLVFLI